MQNYSVPSDDNVTRVLTENNVTESQIQRVRFILLKWFAGKPSDQPYYLVPQITPEQESPHVLTSGDMVYQLERFSPVARSYVELFIAGGLTNPHVGLEEMLSRLEHEK